MPIIIALKEQKHAFNLKTTLNLEIIFVQLGILVGSAIHVIIMEICGGKSMQNLVMEIVPNVLIQSL